jgi:hypothetical protein
MAVAQSDRVTAVSIRNDALVSNDKWVGHDRRPIDMSESFLAL